MKDKKNERRAGFYWFDDVPYISVTTALKCIDKPALRYWFGREVYYAMAKDPTLDEKTALSAPYKKKVKAGARGSTVHSIVEAWKKEGTRIDKLPEEYQGYAQAFYNWVDDNKVELKEHEKTVISKTHRYAGTLDLIVKKNGSTWIIDVKTGKDIYLEAYLQLSAYKHALEEDYGTKIQRMGVLLLKDDGNYKFEESSDNFDVFIAVKKLWEFLNKDICEKVEYKGGEQDE